MQGMVFCNQAGKTTGKNVSHWSVSLQPCGALGRDTE